MLLERDFRGVRNKVLAAESAALYQRRGRPYIGPKAQTAIPTALFLAVLAEAEARDCELSEVWRELILTGARVLGLGQ